MDKIKLLFATFLLFTMPVKFACQNPSSKKIDSLEKVINTSQGQKKADALIVLAGEYVDLDPKKGISISKEALKISEDENYTDGLALSYMAIAIFQTETKAIEQQFNAGFEQALKSTNVTTIKKTINILKFLFEEKNHKKIPIYLDKLLPSVKKINNAELLAKIYREKAYYFYGIGNYNQSIDQFKLALAEYKKAKKGSETAGMTMNIGVLYFKASQLDSSLKFYNEAKIFFEKNKDLKNEASAITNIAMTLEKLGRVPDALILLKTAEKKYAAAKDQALLAAVYEIIATTYQDLGDLNTAINYTFKAANMRELEKDTSMLCNSYTNLAQIYFSLNNYDRSEYYSKKGIEISIKKHKKEVLASGYSNLGLLFDKKNMPDSNLYYQKLSLKIREEMGMEIEMAESYNNIAGYYFDSQNFTLASFNYKKAIELSEKNNSLEKLPNYLKGLAKCFLIDLKYNAALPLLLKAEKILLISKRQAELLEIYENIAICYNGINNYKMAYQYLNMNKQLNDSIFDTQKSKTNAELLEKYETDKKQKEISLLTKDKELKNLQYKQQQENLNQQRKLLIIALICFILLSCLAFFLFKSNREKKLANKIILSQKLEVESQKEIVEEKNNEIIDSILYAKKIQDVLLINTSLITKNFEDSFILFKPKDIVSGDFYWGVEKEDLVFIAACDSTGHGVPGAFMSLLNMSFLNEAIKERNILSPDKILNYVRERLIETVSKDGAQDGMDGVVICFDRKKNKMSYAAAHNPPIIIREKTLLPLRSDKMPIGKGIKTEPFQLFELEIKPQDMIYLVTDGFYDQFGGPKGKKLKQKNLLPLLIDASNTNCKNQLTTLSNYFDTWKGNLEQIDDVTIIGLKV